ncbi:hypothetical protein CkaCkLH20_06884 [Colletotrichum karsti]|uniref:Uncharacterized protein n=1 Tax=Colletotrichum karsti TaxID=1095194 RepID=A0A9P6LJB0_9PEZI|nr:uncharacterized protein CkaCkLH20_06884 [Colletotrichum karsti]KAF9875503.1 hypothetical protein CkaCkLH20_06884 [Colletotrichum karsti]
MWNVEKLAGSRRPLVPGGVENGTAGNFSNPNGAENGRGEGITEDGSSSQQPNNPAGTKHEPEVPPKDNGAGGGFGIGFCGGQAPGAGNDNRNEYDNNQQMNEGQELLPRQTLTVENFQARDPPPATTPAPKLRSREDLSLQHHEPLGSNTCGFFTLGHDHALRTQMCEDIASECTAWQSWLGCGYRPHTTCLQGTAPECRSGMTIGSETLCCTSATGWLPECQTFLRDEGGLGTKTLLGCRNAAVSWDATVWLHTSAEEALGNTRAAPTTTSSPSTTSTAPTTSVAKLSNDGSSAPVGPIVGGVLGGLAILAIAGCIVVWLIVQRRRGASRPFRWSTAIQELHHGGPQTVYHEPQTEGFEKQSRSQPMSPVSPVRVVYKAPVGEKKPVQRVSAVGHMGSPSKPAELG